jgi:hypothetical protein
MKKGFTEIIFQNPTLLFTYSATPSIYFDGHSFKQCGVAPATPK